MDQQGKEKLGAAVVAGLVMALALWYTLFSPPALGIAGTGSYQGTLEMLRLTPFFDASQGQYPVDGAYAIGNYEFARLLRLDTPLIAYVAALARIPLRLLGAPMTAQAMACVYIVLLSGAAGLLAAALWQFGRGWAIGGSVGLITLLMHNGLSAYLCSFDEIGAALTAFVLFVCATLFACLRPRGSGTRYALLVLFCGALLLKARAQLVGLLPAVVLISVLAAVHCAPRGPRWVLHGLTCACALVLMVSGGVAVYRANGDIHTDAANYLAVFQGYLPTAENPAALLEDMGLDESFAADIGRSYYEPEESFAHPPRAASAETWLSQISSTRRLQYCLTHPNLLLRLIEERRTHLYDPLNGQMAVASGQERYQRPSLWALIFLLVKEEGFARQNLLMVLAVGLSLLAAAVYGGKSGVGKVFLAFSALFVCCLMYLPLCVALTGGVTFDTDKVLFFFFGWSGLFVAAAAAGGVLSRLVAFLGNENSRLRPVSVGDAAYVPLLSGRVGQLRLSSGQVTALCVCLAALMLGVTLGPEAHVGGVNNGDFGRMMNQLDLYWLPEQLEHSEQQLAWGVIEDYDYREPFHAARLTPLDPTYSLLFPSMLVRAICGVLRIPYSTRVQVLVLAGIVLAALISLAKDLYRALGRMAVLPMVLLTVMVFGENYIAWYNSLLGESTVIPGMMVILAAAVHLMVMEKGKRVRFAWLALLAVGVRCVACSKAQMLLALPGGLLLLVALALYHRPHERRRVIAFGAALALCCGWLCWDAYGIFAKNAQESDRQTVWQSVFFGALMVTDDPEAAMAELGIDPALAQDIGKNAYEGNYAYDFYSTEMDEAFFDHVNTSTLVKFYLTHPKELWRMLNRAAQESVELHTGFMAYTGEIYAESEGIRRVGLWRTLRPLTAGRSFLWYLAAYGMALGLCARTLLRHDKGEREKLFALLFVAIMLIGVFQFPLTVVGNGFADNNKQLFSFMLCHDLLVIFALTWGAVRLTRWITRREVTLMQKEARPV